MQSQIIYKNEQSVLSNNGFKEQKSVRSFGVCFHLSEHFSEKGTKTTSRTLFSHRQINRMYFSKKVWYSYKTFCTWITIMNYKNSSGQKNIKNILVIKCYERERIITSFLSNAWPLDTTKISKSDISIHTTPEQACLS